MGGGVNPRYVESAVLACLSKFGGCKYGTLRGW
jgi:hypothetical protein